MEKINLENLTGDQVINLLKFINEIKDDINKVNYIHLPFRKSWCGKELEISLNVTEGLSVDNI
jgi:hypothetical protein